MHELQKSPYVFDAASQVLELPASSVAVTVTTFVPTSNKEPEGISATDVALQLSVGSGIIITRIRNYDTRIRNYNSGITQELCQTSM